MENYFPVSADPRQRYIAGLSLGGYGALLHGIEHPERYSAIGAFSSGIPAKGAEGKPDRIPRADLYEVTENALAQGKHLPDLFLCIGQNDFLYPVVTDYHNMFGHRWPGGCYRYDDLPGYEHEFAICDREVEAFLSWIRREDAYAHRQNKV